ncbi:hypothetical protein TEA_024968 [Camellia sinensis var. sinensis]|uniref:Uncharacterized protein n=1 Tax=Camellia sinensis var. sinensis TaxID=542762 RepID=A0A4S4ES73_CAMSN|nr:hypothetical protein TEA_024968 [Camellia sinensis var. sinensis]
MSLIPMMGKDAVLLETALKYVSSLLDAPDIRGKKPLSYAASIGYVDGVCYILDTFVDCTYKRDGDGSYPIHEASSQGHIAVVKEFLRRFPDSRELLNEQGQNILHVAAESGKANIVSYMLKNHELEMLINDTDEDGNTPLLLATKNAHAEIVSILTWDKRVRLEIMDRNGFTALEAALNYVGHTPSIHQVGTKKLELSFASTPELERNQQGRKKPKTKKKGHQLQTSPAKLKTILFDQHDRKLLAMTSLTNKQPEAQDSTRQQDHTDQRPDQQQTTGQSNANYTGEATAIEETLIHILTAQTPNQDRFILIHFWYCD